MIPLYSRVAAIDDDEDHLQKIVWGLGKAGFCAVPFLFEDGKLENPPSSPLPGLRIVFSDIHLVGGGHQEKTHAANIIRCLKQIVSHGPYVLIFWSQFAGDGDSIASLINERASEAGLTPPIGYAAISKADVITEGGSDSFNSEKLREQILNEIGNFNTLAVAANWEDRVARATARTTDRLFQLVKDSNTISNDWPALLAYLASEAVGQEQAKSSLTEAIDAAFLPLLEDQLSLIGNEPKASINDAQHLLDLLSADGGCKCPETVAKSRLNTSYLVEELKEAHSIPTWGRGTVTTLGGGFINSGPFIRAFGCGAEELIRREFACRNLTDVEKDQVKLHVVELGPECDHVQGKVSTHRYLLALLVPIAILNAFCEGKKSTHRRYRNSSVLDIGQISLTGVAPGDYHLLISCRCFMSLAAGKALDGKPKLRLRRALIEEVAHHYVTHTRRPGVMRFLQT